MNSFYIVTYTCQPLVFEVGHMYVTTLPYIRYSDSIKQQSIAGKDNEKNMGLSTHDVLSIFFKSSVLISKNYVNLLSLFFNIQDIRGLHTV